MRTQFSVDAVDAGWNALNGGVYRSIVGHERDARIALNVGDTCRRNRGGVALEGGSVQVMDLNAVRTTVRRGQARHIALVIVKDHNVVFRTSRRRRALANYLIRSNRSRDDCGKTERQCKTTHGASSRNQVRQTKGIGDAPDATCHPAFCALLAAFLVVFSSRADFLSCARRRWANGNDHITVDHTAGRSGVLP